MKRSVPLAAIVAATAACTGPIPGVPPVEFRLNSPAQPTTVNDNHQETHTTTTTTTNVQVVQPVLVPYLYPVPVPSAAAPTPAPAAASHTASPPLPSLPTSPQPSSPTAFATPAVAPVAEPMLDKLAAVEVPGMRPLGPAVLAHFREGQAFELPLPLEPGRCYSIVGKGVGIAELDLELVVWSPSSPSGVLAHRRSTAAPSQRNARCFRHSMTVEWPGKIVVRAARGSGFGVARVYVD